MLIARLDVVCFNAKDIYIMPRKLMGFAKSLKHKLRETQARKKRKKLSNLSVIAITGSCGKTSTTRFLGHILTQHGKCHIGINDNGWMSIIRSLGRAGSDQQFFVQEVSGHKPGALMRVLSILQPSVGIVTTVGQDHLTNFRTCEKTAQEKGTLPEMLPDSGVAILNADDPYVLPMADRTGARVITYGQSPQADVVGSDIRFSWPEGLSLTVTYKGESVRVETKLFGHIWVVSLLAAIAGALSVGVDLKSCAQYLISVKPYNRRMSVHRSSAGMWLINDCFKAPYWSIPAVIQNLEGIDAPRKTIVIGSFSDNASSASKKYRRLAKQGLDVADRVIFVGKYSHYVSKMIVPEIQERLLVMESLEQANQFLFESALEDEVVLLKASAKEHLERLVHGQSYSLKCWKPYCKLSRDCATCQESGMNVADENQLITLPGF